MVNVNRNVDPSSSISIPELFPASLFAARLAFLASFLSTFLLSGFTAGTCPVTSSASSVLRRFGPRNTPTSISISFRCLADILDGEGSSTVGAGERGLFRVCETDVIGSSDSMAALDSNSKNDGISKTPRWNDLRVLIHVLILHSIIFAHNSILAI